MAASTPGGLHVLLGELSRRHVSSFEWEEAATDFWLVAGSIDLSAVQSASNVAGLSGWGWTFTSVGFTAGSGSDFLSSTDDTPPQFSSNASGDVIRSPQVFGDYVHGLLAKAFLGNNPTKLCLEFYGNFPTASANEAATYIGFDDGSGISAGIYSNGTNFILSNGVTTDAGALIDTANHLWKIVVDSVTGLIEWFIDGVSQGTVAITQDIWPAAFACVASTTNRWALTWAHVWYE